MPRSHRMQFGYIQSDLIRQVPTSFCAEEELCWLIGNVHEENKHHSKCLSALKPEDFDLLQVLVGDMALGIKPRGTSPSVLTSSPSSLASWLSVTTHSLPPFTQFVEYLKCSVFHISGLVVGAGTAHKTLRWGFWLQKFIYDSLAKEETVLPVGNYEDETSPDLTSWRKGPVTPFSGN